jgi:hypothetical protein
MPVIRSSALNLRSDSYFSFKGINKYKYLKFLTYACAEYLGWTDFKITN